MSDLVLLSGGIDSALCLRMSLKNGRRPVALGFDYGQPHRVELEYARVQARQLGVDYFVEVLPTLGKSDDLVFIGRNLLFIAAAIPVAVSRGCDSIVIGANAGDYGRFPDCREDFMMAVDAASKVYGVSVTSPLLGMSKSDVVAAYRGLGGDIQATWSCYQPTVEGKRCGTCYACNAVKGAL